MLLLDFYSASHLVISTNPITMIMFSSLLILPFHFHFSIFQCSSFTLSAVPSLSPDVRCAIPLLSPMFYFHNKNVKMNPVHAFWRFCFAVAMLFSKPFSKRTGLFQIEATRIFSLSVQTLVLCYSLVLVGMAFIYRARNPPHWITEDQGASCNSLLCLEDWSSYQKKQ